MTAIHYFMMGLSAKTHNNLILLLRELMFLNSLVFVIVTHANLGI
jgi:hypothetical protein